MITEYFSSKIRTFISTSNKYFIVPYILMFHHIKLNALLFIPTHPFQNYFWCYFVIICEKPVSPKCLDDIQFKMFLRFENVFNFTLHCITDWYMLTSPYSFIRSMFTKTQFISNVEQTNRNKSSFWLTSYKSVYVCTIT